MCECEELSQVEQEEDEIEEMCECQEQTGIEQEEEEDISGSSTEEYSDDGAKGEGGDKVNPPDAAGVQHLPASGDYIARSKRETELFFADKKSQGHKNCPRCRKHSGNRTIICPGDGCGYAYRLSKAKNGYKPQVYVKKGYRSPNKVRVPALSKVGKLRESTARVKAAYDEKTASAEQVHNEMAFYADFEDCRDQVATLDTNPL